MKLENKIWIEQLPYAIWHNYKIYYLQINWTIVDKPKFILWFMTPYQEWLPINFEWCYIQELLWHLSEFVNSKKSDEYDLFYYFPKKCKNTIKK